MTTIDRGIGLLGGTFDPVHNGHLTVAHHALSAMRLARIEFVLAPRPWQKAVATSVSHRLMLLSEAIAGNEKFAVNMIEVMRDGPTYTIETLRQMRETVGPACPLVLIMGADQWENFHTWKNWDAFGKYVNIALCNRESHVAHARNEVEALWRGNVVPPEAINALACGKLTHFQIPAHSASSTKIRQVFTQKSREEAFRILENWLPVRVARTIAAHKLY